MFSKSLWAALLIASPATMLEAKPGVVVSYDMLPRLVRSQNPELTAARVRIREALARSAKAGRHANPELETSVEQNSRFREWKAEIGFTQRFPVTDRLRLEREIGLTEVKAAEAEVREVERQLVAAAREAMVEIQALRQRRDLLVRQRKLSEEFATFLDQVAGKGEGSPLDAGMAQIEAAGVDLTLRQIDAEEAAATGRLKTALGTPAGTPLGISGTLPPPARAAASANPARRADLQARTIAAEAAGRGVDLERARKYEDLEAGIFAGTERREDAPNGFDREALVGLRLRIPLPLWNDNRAAVDEAEAKHQRARLEADALEKSIRLESETTRAEMDRWAKLVSEIEQTLLPLADKQAAEAEKAFRNGQGDLQTVFRSREKHLAIASSRLDALRQFHLARVRHDAANGNSN